jgi:SAM-dependent methyltransferase
MFTLFRSIKRALQILYSLLVLIGVDPFKTVHFVRGLPFYFRDLRSQSNNAKMDFPFGRIYPCLSERFEKSGDATGHYFHQDLLVARRIFLNKPIRHLDVGSRVDGFVAHVASFRSIEVIDIRPLSSNIPNVSFLQADITAPLPKNLIGYSDSLSSLHTIEHIGLGRYGDPVMYDGYLVALDNLNRILKRDGRLYFSVPIGPQRIEFNAHRVFAVNYLLECFDDKFHIDRFSFVDDKGDLHDNISLSDTDVRDNFGCIYGCGIFEMTKL